LNKKKSIWIVVGTRPNFIKVTRFRAEVVHFENLEVNIVHTGQHYDEKMATVFFDQFGMRPDRFLEVTPGHPGLQIAETISKLTHLFTEVKPDMVVVVGDVNATLAAAIAANKCEVAVAHLESGLRSNDLTMPEEHNRKVADDLASLHFITEDSGLRNLRAEGKREAGLALVGNTMIDTLVAYRDQINASTILQTLELPDTAFALVTMHRPSNVDTLEGLSLVGDVLDMLTSKIPVVFVAHPRTASRIETLGLKPRFDKLSGLHLVPPLGYYDFQHLVAASRLVLTDSGGIQEETTYLQKPCLTFRPNTERPVTITEGSNTLLEFDPVAIAPLIELILSGNYKKGRIPLLWDGNATRRVLERIDAYFQKGC